VATHSVALTRLRILVLVVLGVAIIASVLWILQRRPGYQPSTVKVVDPAVEVSTVVPTPSAPVNLSTTPETAPPASSPTASPMVGGQLGAAAPSPGPSLDPTSQFPASAFALDLIVPVQGVRPDQLRDTFNESRSEGRTHDAIDIIAPAATPVLAAADGEIIKLFESKQGGTTIYQRSAVDKQVILYYAHLQGYVEGLAVGKFARKGEVIGYVGDTGNAGPGNYHLHFSISIVLDPKRYWEGKNINPYPLLRSK
jgi:murein DD-endopeptidase MepM/ murein hydrolase activator NlpD